MSITLDHLDIDDDQRALIEKSVDDTDRVMLAPLDKGLSGASVWRARWRLSTGTMSVLHVFKIGPLEKIQRELDAITTTAAVIDDEVRVPLLFTNGNLGLLRQNFAGQDPERVRSLRDWIEACDGAGEARRIIGKLYRDRMRSWRPNDSDCPRAVAQPMAHALDWWVGRADISTAAEAVGSAAVEASLQRFHGTSLEDLRDGVNSLLERTESITVGPVHGDLHAQNVLVDVEERLHLIDFGWCNQRWTAIDYLMMECSLKFVAAPSFVQLADLLEMEAKLEQASDDLADDGFWDDAPLYGLQLEKIARCIMEIRSAALEHGCVTDLDQYRRGLTVLTYGLTSMPKQINHAYMLHALALGLERV